MLNIHTFENFVYWNVGVQEVLSATYEAVLLFWINVSLEGMRIYVRPVRSNRCLWLHVLVGDVSEITFSH
jgi:hypothetical protein